MIASLVDLLPVIAGFAVLYVLANHVWPRRRAIADHVRSRVVAQRARRLGTFHDRPPTSWCRGLTIAPFGRGVAVDLRRGVEGTLAGGRAFRAFDLTVELWQDRESSDPAGERDEPEPERTPQSRVFLVALDHPVAPALIRGASLDPTRALADAARVEDAGLVVHARAEAYARAVLAAVRPSLAHWPAERPLDVALDGGWLVFAGLPADPGSWGPWRDFGGDLANLVSNLGATATEGSTPADVVTGSPGFVLGRPDPAPTDQRWLWPWSQHSCTLVAATHGTLLDGSPAYAGSVEWWERREIVVEGAYDLGDSPRLVEERRTKVHDTFDSTDRRVRITYRVRMRQPIVAVANPRSAGAGLVIAQRDWSTRMGPPVAELSTSQHVWNSTTHLNPEITALVATVRPMAVAWTTDWVIGFTHRNRPNLNRDLMDQLVALRDAALDQH